MLYLYLDESGDLGFNFIAKEAVKLFTVTIVAIRGLPGNVRTGKEQTGQVKEYITTIQ